MLEGGFLPTMKFFGAFESKIDSTGSSIASTALMAAFAHQVQETPQSAALLRNHFIQNWLLSSNLQQYRDLWHASCLWPVVAWRPLLKNVTVRLNPKPNNNKQTTS